LFVFRIAQQVRQGTGCAPFNRLAMQFKVNVRQSKSSIKYVVMRADP